MLNIYVSSVAHVSVISSPMIVEVVGILYEFVLFFCYMIIEYDLTSLLIFSSLLILCKLINTNIISKIKLKILVDEMN